MATQRKLILIFAIAGTGSRYFRTLRDGHNLIDQIFIKNPTYLEAVVVNFVAFNIFIVCIFFVGGIVTRLRQKG